MAPRGCGRPRAPSLSPGERREQRWRRTATGGRAAAANDGAAERRRPLRSARSCGDEGEGGGATEPLPPLETLLPRQATRATMAPRGHGRPHRSNEQRGHRAASSLEDGPAVRQRGRGEGQRSFLSPLGRGRPLASTAPRRQQAAARAPEAQRGPRSHGPSRTGLGPVVSRVVGAPARR